MVWVQDLPEASARGMRRERPAGRESGRSLPGDYALAKKRLSGEAG